MFNSFKGKVRKWEKQGILAGESSGNRQGFSLSVG